MIIEPVQAEDEFDVLCTWCGVRIRTNRTEEAYGTCLDCFYQIVAEQLNLHKPSGSALMASDR